MNTNVVELSEPRSVWTPKDEALLNELSERKERIMGERRNAIMQLVNDGEIVDLLITNADAFILALTPFATT